MPPQHAAPQPSHALDSLTRPRALPSEPIALLRDVIHDKPWTKFEGVELAPGIPASPQANDFSAFINRDPFPLPATEDRELYHGQRHYDYWLSGLKDYLLIRQRLRAHARDLAPGDRVLDLGCASGRVLRHFLCQHDNLEVWGCDIAPAHAEWCRRHLGPRPRVLGNHALPSLPLPDASLDLVTAFSVFTHIDEFELGWLCEIRRILRPGGLAYLTIHSERTWDRLGQDHRLPLFTGMTRRMDTAVPPMKIRPKMFDSAFPHERMVFCACKAETYGCNVFHRTSYIQDTWGRFMDVLAILPCHPQDAVLLRRP